MVKCFEPKLFSFVNILIILLKAIAVHPKLVFHYTHVFLVLNCMGGDLCTFSLPDVEFYICFQNCKTYILNQVSFNTGKTITNAIAYEFKQVEKSEISLLNL
jgi:hypothetical protein